MELVVGLGGLAIVKKLNHTKNECGNYKEAERICCGVEKEPDFYKWDCFSTCSCIQWKKMSICLEILCRAGDTAKWLLLLHA